MRGFRARPADLAGSSARTSEHRAVRTAAHAGGSTYRASCAARIPRDAGPSRERQIGADRLRRCSGGDHLARGAVPYDAGEHRAADHGGAGHQHAGRPRPRARDAMRRRNFAQRRKARTPSGTLGWACGRTHRSASRGLARAAPSPPCRESRLIPQPSPATAIVNALTIDVEDYFQVSAFADHVSRGDWDTMPCRVERNIDRILALLEEADVRATFFTLGWIAERYPDLIRRIGDAGHELASHGFSHQRATDQQRGEFLADIRLAKAVLEDISGKGVSGYRAPSFSVGPDNVWAFDCISEAGYRYSSSVYPIRHDHYGVPDGQRFAHESSPGVLELPVATVRMFSKNWPAGGGGYFRLLPYFISRWSIRRINDVDRKPAMFYFHPWELDPDQPRVQGIRAKTRFRHYLNLKRTEPRLRRLVTDFRWDRVDKVFLDGAG